ncbi:hypothetical protein EZMO1_0898 [Endozoicomonas montiporae CL-33]|uniref:Uncharacterized protein n=1 Tax=Endozoicomonas montiporae CL-33 TaxID=570277 RepID=A0A142B8N7_9GAMM|nr:hypothetical protein EZMO1_0898 [Endozoicomonas montiporae CL-33]
MDMKKEKYNLELNELVILSLSFGSVIAALHFFFASVF